MAPWFVALQRLLVAIGLAALILANHAAFAVEFTSVEFAGKSFTVARVNVRDERLRLFHRDETGQPFGHFNRLASWLAARGQRLTFAMNAGMYHGDLSAVGLFVSDGRQAVRLNTASGRGNFFLKPNGVFVVTEVGARVIESSQYPKLGERVMLATQSGPLLVQDGKLHPAFKADSDSRLFRNGVGVPSPDTALFVISEAPVNFYEFATLFRDELGCPNALFLDGSISSLYSVELKRSDFTLDLGPMIGVIE